VNIVRLGIKGKQVLGVTSIVGAVVVVLSLLNLARLARVSLEESQARADFIARAIYQRAREVIREGSDPYKALRGDPGLRSILTSSLYSKNVTFAAIVDVYDLVVAHADPALDGQPLPPGGDLSKLLSRPALSQLVAIYSGQGRNLELQQPLLLGNTQFGSLRIGVSTLAFLKYERNYNAQLKALDYVPEGSKVLALATIPCRNVWYTTRMEHLSSMATVRRDAFVNDQWVAPGAQLLRIKYHAAGRYFSHDPSQILRNPSCRARNEPILDLALAVFPRPAFDYVWMIDMPKEHWPIDPGLRPVWQGKRFGILYRIIHRPEDASWPGLSATPQAGSATASSETPNGSARRVTQ